MAHKNATQVSFLVKGVNKTGKVFSEITKSALRVGKTAALFGAAATAGATAAFAATAKSLGHLSDVAMQASTSTLELTKMSNALGVLGIKSQSPEQLAMAFQKMTKATGQTGVEGFKKAAAAIAEMETAEERSAAAMAVFGESGLDFMPIIEGIRENGVSAFEDVMAGMSGVSDAAANNGDAVAKAMQIMTNGTKSLWQEAVGKVCGMLDEQFEGGVREASMRAVAWMKYGAKLAWRHMVATFENLVKAYKAMSADWGKTFSEMFTMLWKTFKSFAKFLWEQIKNIGAVIRDFLKQVWSGLSGDGFSWEKVVENANFAEVAKNFADEVKGAMDDVSIFDNVEWSKVDASDLQAVRDREISAAKDAAAAMGKAAKTTVTEIGDEASDKVKKAAKAASNELVHAGSYRAATFSLAAGYGRGEDRTVAAVKGIKAVNEKIKLASERTANFLESLNAT